MIQYFYYSFIRKGGIYGRTQIAATVVLVLFELFLIIVVLRNRENQRDCRLLEEVRKHSSEKTR